MKKKSPVAMLFLAIFLFAISSCSKSDGIIQEPDNTPTDYRLKDNVVEVKVNDIVSIEDGTSIIISDQYSKEDLPEIGEIIFVYPTAPKAVNGFMGKVRKINKTGKGTEFITDPVPLDNVFSYLHIDQTIDLEPYTDFTKSISPETKASFEVIDGYNCIIQEMAISEKFKNGISVGSNGSLTLGLRLHTEIDIDDEKDIQYLRTEISSLVKINLDLHFKAEIGDKLKIDIPNIEFRIPLSVASLIATPAVVPAFALNMEAATQLSGEASLSSEHKIWIEYENGIWKCDRPKDENGTTKEPSFNLKPDAKLQIEGSLFYGIATCLQLRLFNREDMSLSINPMVGVEKKAQMSYSPLEDKSIYEALKGKTIQNSVVLKVDANAKANIFNRVNLECDFDLLEVPLRELPSSYIFPEIADAYFRMAGGTIEATATLKGNLLFNTPTGIAAYDKTGNILLKSNPVPYKKEKEFNNPLTASFKDIPATQQYTINTYYQWGNAILKGEELSLKIDKRLKSMNLTNYTDRNEVYNFEYTPDGKIKLITLTYVKYNETDSIAFEYSADGQSLKTLYKYVMDTGNYDQDIFEFTLNSSGYIVNGLQKYSNGDEAVWQYEYDNSGRLVKSYRSEDNETWTLKYDSNSNVEYATSYIEGENIKHTITYSDIQNFSNFVMHELMYGIDIDEMQVYGFVGLLGKPSRHLPVTTNADNRINYVWETDKDGFPVKVKITESDDSDYSERYDIVFTWE